MSRVFRDGLRRRRQHDGEAGVSLAEMMVTITLLSLLLTMLVGLVINVSRTFTENRAKNDSTNMASIAMNETTRVIRSGTEIRVASSP